MSGGRRARVGSDTGGTFTDLVTAEGAVVKVPSTPDDPGRAVREGLDALGVVGAPTLCHGTTVATNAVLERTGGPAALVTTEGFADVIEIGRQDRPSLYDTTVDRPEPLVARHLRLEVRERLAADGSVIVPLDEASLRGVVDRLVQLAREGSVASVAVALLHADLNDAHERAVGVALREAGLDVSCSHEVSPEFREYERTATAVVNAYLRPVCRPYLEGLATVGEPLWVMTSAGGLTGHGEATTTPARLVLSGPAGGARAAAGVARANGLHHAVSFDMGGTSTDVCLIVDGAPSPAGARQVGGMPLRLPSLDVHTIGAGGGSIAALDPGGALGVGPRSAGAVPGPACYGLGGTEPTVTDANLVLGRFPPGVALAGIGPLDPALAAAALERAGVTAEGVVAVVNAAMEQALREVTVARGVDPVEVALVAFGGAGGLHACELADALGIPTVVVPARAGVFSAVGVLCAPRLGEAVRSWPTPHDHRGLDAALGVLADHVAAEVGTEVGLEAADMVVSTAVDCRYAGQSHELTVAEVAAFHHEHERRNGYRRDDAPVEVVALRATASVAAPVDVTDLAVTPRASVVGPAVVAEPDCTIWVPAGWQGEPGAAGALVLRRVTGAVGVGGGR